MVQVVAGPRFSGFGSGYGLALSSTGQVYSWGKGVHGRLGHPSPSEDCVVPKIVERLAGKDIVLVCVCLMCGLGVQYLYSWHVVMTTVQLYHRMVWYTHLVVQSTVKQLVPRKGLTETWLQR